MLLCAVLLHELLCEHQAMADLGEKVEAYWATDLGESLEDGASEHAIVGVLSRCLYFRQKSDMVTGIGLDGLAGLFKDG